MMPAKVNFPDRRNKVRIRRQTFLMLGLTLKGGFGMDIYYHTAKLILRIYQTVFHQDRHVGGELDPGPGPKIIAANHPNASDGFHIPFIFQQKLYFFMQADIFSIPFFGWLLARNGQIPVLPTQNKAALERGYELLAHGQSVVIFPEGRLNPDNQHVKAGCGAIWMSLMTGAAILPMGFFVPTQNVHNLVIRKDGRQRQGRWQTGGRCYIRIGRCWFPRQEIDGKLNSMAVHKLTDCLMEKIETLAHMAYLDWAGEKELLREESHAAF